MNITGNIPAPGLPLMTPDGRMSPVWFQFFMTLFSRTGGTQGATVADLRQADIDIDADLVDASVARLGRVSSDISLLLQTLPDDTRGPSVADQVNLDVALILHEAQDALTKATRRLQDALIEQAMMVDVIRSMASQDSANVNITGGSITGMTKNTATGVALTDDTATNATMYPVFGTGTSSPVMKISSTKLTWNPSTGLLTVPSVSAQLNGALGLVTPASAAVTTLSASGQIASTLATGTAPLSVASTTVVPNLNVSQLLGFTWAAPGAIGSTTPSTGVFTSLSVGGQTVGAADFRTAAGATVVAGRTSNVGNGSQPGAFAVYAPNGSGTAMIWGQARVVVTNATAGSEACSLIFSTRVAGAFADCVTIDSSGNLVNQKGVADQAYSYQTPATGFAITIGAGIRTLILDPAGTLASGTVTMPAAPVDGQKIRLASSQSITALTVAANTGQSIKNAPTAFTTSTTGPQGYEFEYRSNNTTWYRLQ